MHFFFMKYICNPKVKKQTLNIKQSIILWRLYANVYDFNPLLVQTLYICIKKKHYRKTTLLYFADEDIVSAVKLQTRGMTATDSSSVWATAAEPVKLSLYLSGRKKPLLRSRPRGNCLTENPMLASIPLLHLWHSHLSRCIAGYETDLDIVGFLYSKCTVLNMNSPPKKMCLMARAKTFVTH